ncbi:hypothetical protein SODALDRAFT_319240 [Sodiomyces alkalinus F11]|uniref:Uncharacterized protein n=1 Tax=Sodiomyces alkalinus (strain CBS 110278 / VKM F-3762 / F11) TaxID=1314773 RepID=A0A3N2Q741_SODAK|nr:hypothetical protein SODALDRAFT_319240 [Sodiomyces alkalinus F11]ROT42603.1 hypothetical protein SODALDRAFT_319240 [Sodiomyces alkalinus F11]
MDVAEFVDSLLQRVIHMEPLHRMFALWIFCLGGILMAVQASQAGEPNGFQWTRLTPERAPFWFSLYVLEALLFVTGAYPVFKQKMSNFFLFGGHEEKILNGLWVGLLGLEFLMVVSATFLTISRRLKGAPKQKTQ